MNANTPYKVDANADKVGRHRPDGLADSGQMRRVDMGRRWSQWSRSRLLYSKLPDKNVKYFRNRNIGLQSDGDR